MVTVGTNVWVLTREEPHPETRVDHGAVMTEIVGVYADEDAARRAAADDDRDRRFQIARDEGYDTYGEWLLAEGYDPFPEVEYSPVKMEVKL